MAKGRFTIIIAALVITTMTGCSTRELNGKLSGSTAQRLISYSVDDLVGKLPADQFSGMAGKRVFLDSHFMSENEFKSYADNRLKIELATNWKANVVHNVEEADWVMTVFYTSLATDIDNFGITIPLNYIPAFSEAANLNVITLEKFHGISEMYYYLGPVGQQIRGKTIQAVVKTDALGLPFITIPISNADRLSDD